MRNEDAVPFILVCVIFIAIIIGITIQVFFLLTLSRCLSAIRPRNREMEPGLVWLNLIPCVPIVFNFFIVLKIAASLKKEYRSRRWRTEGEGFGSGVGLTYAICSVIGLIPYAGALAAIPGLVCWIIYWVQIAGYTTKLESRSAKDLPEDDFDDDFDAPRRSRQRDEEDADDRDRSNRPRRRRDEYDDDEPDDRIRAR